MTKIAFVACSKTKGDHPAPAAALYTSALFRKSLLAALDANDTVYILSAKHGVLSLDQFIKPYDLTLKTMRSDEKVEWGTIVGLQLESLVGRRDGVSLYCGEDYTAPIIPYLAKCGCRIIEPLKGLSIGPRLSRLRIINGEAELEAASFRFNALMRRLWRGQEQGVRFDECAGRVLPQRGVYFILEQGAGHRVARVGTHAVSQGSRTTLWNRLSTHRGNLDGRGSHRSSIFRSHVGRALTKQNPSGVWPASWGQGQQAPAEVRATEVDLERKVSEHIGMLPLLWLAILDDAGAQSDRAYIERNAIGLLSRAGLLAPRQRKGWLGLHSHDWRIAASGLWNLDYLFTRPDVDFLDVLERYVDITLGVEPQPIGSIAPVGWRERKPTKINDQLSLFPGG